MNQIEISRFPALEYHTKEAMNTLCTNLFFTGGDLKKIMISSCRPREGKSFVSMNLMRSLAGLGKKVVLVDADIRASALTGTYGISARGKQSGLSHYLVGLCDMDAILCSTNIENASMVLCGKHVSNSLPLLNSPKFSALLNSLAETNDLVLVDAPPVGAIIDAVEIAKSCDGTIFVVESNLVSRQELIEAMRQIEKTSCPILGTAVNKFDISTFSAKKHYYKSYYIQYDVSTKEKKQVKSSERNETAVRSSEVQNGLPDRHSSTSNPGDRQ